jgi:hypothetical protein
MEIGWVAQKGGMKHGNWHACKRKTQQIQGPHTMPQVRQALLPRKKEGVRFVRIRKNGEDAVLRMGENARMILCQARNTVAESSASLPPAMSRRLCKGLY